MELDEIKIDLLKLWIKAPRLYTQHWDGRKKVLKFFNYAPDGTFQVKVKDKVIYVGKDIEEAVKAYNEL